MTRGHIVIGAGEVGTALYVVLHKAFGDRVLLRDIYPMDAIADVLHICIPWSDTFVKSVSEYREQHSAEFVVVHSTVPVGTCDANGWTHSPIRGRHPELQEGIEKFIKHVGGVNANAVADMFESAGLQVMTHDKADVTEAGKLWELVQFGLQVVIQKDIYAWCEERQLNPDEVYRLFAMTYNDGYSQLGENRFVRPVIKPQPGETIGGHCVVQNAAHIDHPWAKMVTDR